MLKKEHVDEDVKKKYLPNEKKGSIAAPFFSFGRYFIASLFYFFPSNVLPADQVLRSMAS